MKANQNLKLKECSNCGRHFAIDRIQVHQNACKHQKKRKTFDSTKMRVSGTEAESFVKKKKPAKEVKVGFKKILSFF